MATQAQIDANRKNAEKSTGPKTPEGKAKSCMNRLSHGLARSLRFLDLEKAEEFNALLADLTREFQPATPNEQILLEKMALNHWNSIRAMGLQSLVLGATLIHANVPKDFGLFLRYQATADRAYHKAHAELLKAQKQRAESGIGFEWEYGDEAPEAPEAPAEPPQKTAAGFGIYAGIDMEDVEKRHREAIQAEIALVKTAPIEEIFADTH